MKNLKKYYENEDGNQPSPQVEKIEIDKEEMQKIAETLSMASYTMIKHDIHIFNVTEKVNDAEELLFELLKQNDKNPNK